MSDFIIGLSGGIGRGKTTVSDLFTKLGVNIIDADIIAREVVSKGSIALSSISAHFGAEFIQPGGELNRALLRSRIFSNDNDKQWLNDLLHPLIRAEIVAQAKISTSAYCIIVAPLLIENNLTTLVDRVLVIDVKEATQISRTTKRDTSSKQQIEAIMNSQVSRNVRLKHADDVINNDNCSFETLEIAVNKLHKSYLFLVD
jgi:dephospho-CoA kinase